MFKNVEKGGILHLVLPNDKGASITAAGSIWDRKHQFVLSWGYRMIQTKEMMGEYNKRLGDETCQCRTSHANNVSNSKEKRRS